MTESAFGTYLVSDGTKVEFSDALALWIPIAYDELKVTAQRYNEWTTYQALTDRVQDVSGVRTKMLIGNWSGRLLEHVAILARDRNEPPLTALCVHQDGTIGEGYRRAPKSVEADPEADVEQLAAEHRLLCYRAYANDLPSDGGVAAVTPQVAQARARQRRSDPLPMPLCPEHFMELSTTGACAMCD